MKLISIIIICAFAASLAQAEEYLRIGGAFALTGIAAPFGTQESKAAQLAVSELDQRLNSKKIKLIIEDTKSTSLGTVNAVTKLITVDKVEAIVGPTWLDSFQGALPIAAKQNVVIITPSATIDIIKRGEKNYSNVFSTFYNMKKEISYLLKEVSDRKYTKVNFVYDQDPFFEWIHSSLQNEASKYNLTVEGDLSIPLETKDLRSTLLKLGQPEVILFGFSDTSNLLTFLQSSKIIFPKAQLLGTHDIDGFINDVNFKSFLSNVSYAFPIVYNKNFNQKFVAKFQDQPSLTASNAYDAMMILIGGIEKQKDSPESLENTISNMEFDTVTFGRTRFNQLGGIEESRFEIRN